MIFKNDSVLTELLNYKSIDLHQPQIIPPSSKPPQTTIFSFFGLPKAVAPQKKEPPKPRTLEEIKKIILEVLEAMAKQLGEKYKILSRDVKQKTEFNRINSQMQKINFKKVDIENAKTFAEIIQILFKLQNINKENPLAKQADTFFNKGTFGETDIIKKLRQLIRELPELKEQWPDKESRDQLWPEPSLFSKIFL